MNRIPTVIAASTILLAVGCHTGYGIRHEIAFRKIPLGGSIRDPRGPDITIRFIEVRPDGSEALLEVTKGGTTQRGWAREGHSLNEVGVGWASLDKLTPSRATLAFWSAKPI